MKKYFIFKVNGDIVIVDIKEIKEVDDNVIIKRKNDLIKFSSIKFGGFLRVLSKVYNRKTEKERFIYTALEDGGFKYIDTIDDDKTEHVVKEQSLLLGKNTSYILEFPDDDSAALWAEAMMPEYQESRTSNWW